MPGNAVRFVTYFKLEGLRTGQPISALVSALTDDIREDFRQRFLIAMAEGGLTVDLESIDLCLVVDAESVMYGIMVPRWRVQVSAEVSPKPEGVEHAG